MDEKITIIEGPPPIFERVPEAWPMGLSESLNLSNVAITRLRTFNGPALVERCYRAWHGLQTIHLEYRAPDGLEQKAPILAARSLNIENGQLLLLWVRLTDEQVQERRDLDDGLDDDDHYGSSH